MHTHTRAHIHTPTHTHTQDHSDPKQLLSKSNIDRGCLERFSLEATSFATEGALESVEFEKNHRGEKDVALFDFTSLFAAENAARIIERKGRRILLCLGGDSLIEVRVLGDYAASCCVCVCVSYCLYHMTSSQATNCNLCSLVIRTYTCQV